MKSFSPYKKFKAIPTWTKSLICLSVLACSGYVLATRVNTNLAHSVGDELDQFNGVAVYYNGAVSTTVGRRTTADGYNLGLKFQCVEFVKRYYYERFGHKMPDSMGNAKDFFQANLANGQLNTARGLIQYQNGAGEPPQVEDLIIFAPWVLNRYGHVAIVSEVGEDFIEVVQQNAGPFGAARERFALTQRDGRAVVKHERVLGWLRRVSDSQAQALK